MTRKFDTDTKLDDLLYEVEKFFEGRARDGKVSDDLGKVDFDFENYSYENDGFDQYRHLMGLRNLGDLVFCGCSAGGDWEFPVFFILYLNKGSLRGYIPKNGNCWNYHTKMAIGNDEESDAHLINKICNKKMDFAGADDGWLLVDCDKIQQDIEKRFGLDGKKT